MTKSCKTSNARTVGGNRGWGQARANYVHVRKRARNVHVKLIIVHEINVHVYVFHTNKPNSFFQLIVYTGVLFF